MIRVDLRELANKVAAVVLSKVATAIIELAVVVALTRILPKREVAIIALVLVIYQTARFFAVFGLPETVFYFFERLEQHARRAFVLRTAALLAGLGLLAALAILAVRTAIPWILPGWTPADREAVARLLPILAVVVALELPTSHVPNVLLVTDRARQAAWFTLASSVGGFIALLAPLVAGWGPVAICWSLALLAALRLVASGIWMHAVLPLGGRPLPPGLLRQQLGFSGPLALNSVATRLKRYLDRMVVAAMLPALALAEYHVGGQEIPFLPVIAFGVGSVLIGRYVSLQLNGDLDALRELWVRSIRAVSLIVLPATVLVLVLAEDVILLLFGPAYRAAVLPFRIYSCILLVRVAQYGSILQTFGDTKTILRYTAVSLTVNLVLNIPLTYLFGIGGTAFATLASTYLVMALYVRRIASHLNTSVAGVVPLQHYLQVLGLAATLGVGAYALRHVGLAQASRPVALLVTGAVFAVTFTTAGRLLGLISDLQWSILRGWSRLEFLRSRS